MVISSVIEFSSKHFRFRRPLSASVGAFPLLLPALKSESAESEFNRRLFRERGRSRIRRHRRRHLEISLHGLLIVVHVEEIPGNGVYVNAVLVLPPLNEEVVVLAAKRLKTLTETLVFVVGALEGVFGGSGAFGEHLIEMTLMAHLELNAIVETAKVGDVVAKEEFDGLVGRRQHLRPRSAAHRTLSRHFVGADEAEDVAAVSQLVAVDVEAVFGRVQAAFVAVKPNHLQGNEFQFVLLTFYELEKTCFNTKKTFKLYC